MNGVPRRQYRGFAPEAIANIRYRYVETDETQDSIAAEYKTTRKTIERLAIKEGWPLRKDRAPRGLPPELKLHAEVEQALAREPEEGEDRTALAEAFERSVRGQLRAVERMRAMMGSGPSASTDAERLARTLDRLTETLLKIERLRQPQPPASDRVPAIDIPKDIDEFRRRLAFKIEAFVRGRRDGSLPARDGAGGADPAG